MNTGGEETKAGVAPAGRPPSSRRSGRFRSWTSRGSWRSRPRATRARTSPRSGTSLASLGLAGLSMGMSDDFEAAIEEGATVVRVGTALFGARA